MKRLYFLLPLFLCAWLFGTTAFAQEQPEYDPLLYGTLADLVDTSGLTATLSRQERELLRELGVESLDPGALLSLTPQELAQVIGAQLTRQAKAPLMLFGSLLGVLLLCALLDSLGFLAEQQRLGNVYSTLSVLCISAFTAAPLLECVQGAGAAVRHCANFLLGFIPVFAGVLITSGRPLTGASYQMFLFTGCQAAAQLIAGVLIPLVGVWLAFSVVSAALPQVRLGQAAAVVKKTVNWLLALTLTLFLGAMSLHSIVATSADGASVRTVKFLLSSAIPVVGSAVTDAALAARGCLNLLRSMLGGFGILACGVIFLPVLLQTGCWYLVTNAAAAVGELLGVGTVPGLLRSFSGALGTLISLVLTFFILGAAATAVVMVAGGAA